MNNSIRKLSNGDFEVIPQLVENLNKGVGFDQENKEREEKNFPIEFK